MMSHHKLGIVGLIWTVPLFLSVIIVYFLSFDQPWTDPKTWLLQRWQSTPWWWSGNDPWPNWTPSDWYTCLLMATSLKRWSQEALSPTLWEVWLQECCTPSPSLLREVIGPVHLRAYQRLQVSITKFTESNVYDNVDDTQPRMYLLDESVENRLFFFVFFCRLCPDWALLSNTAMSDTFLSIITQILEAVTTFGTISVQQVQPHL